MASYLVPGAGLLEAPDAGGQFLLPGGGIFEAPATATDPEIASIDPAPPLTVGQTSVQLIGLRFGT